MNKEEIIATIRNEIERIYATKHDQQCDFSDGYFTALSRIDEILDTLESEKPAAVGLEKAANEYAEKHGFRVPYDGSNNFYDEVDVKASKEGFIAGTEWQKEHMKETHCPRSEKWKEVVSTLEKQEALSKPLATAARRYAIPTYMKDVDENFLDEYPYDPVAEKAFIAGAEWDREQHKLVPDKYAEMDFESARNAFSEDVYNHNRKNKTPIDMVDLDDAFETGSYWMEKHMMKEAVEGEVIVPIYEGDDTWSAEIKIPGRYEIGDKVKIIVIHETGLR